MIMCVPGEGPEQSSRIKPRSGSRDVILMIGIYIVDVELSSCLDRTMRTLKKRTMGVGPPTDEALSTRAWNSKSS